MKHFHKVPCNLGTMQPISTSKIFLSKMLATQILTFYKNRLSGFRDTGIQTSTHLLTHLVHEGLFLCFAFVSSEQITE